MKKSIYLLALFICITGSLFASLSMNQPENDKFSLSNLATTAFAQCECGDDDPEGIFGEEKCVEKTKKTCVNVGGVEYCEEYTYCTNVCEGWNGWCW